MLTRFVFVATATAYQVTQQDGSEFAELQRILMGELENQLPAEALGDAGSLESQPLPPVQQGCHPKCKWECAQANCESSCEPVCAPPRCNTQCQALDISKCKRKCEKPNCAVVCPQSLCSGDDCQDCKTICAPPKCKTDCEGNGCQSVCAKPECEWKCAANECVKPVCSLKCDQGHACKSQPGDGKIPIIEGGTVNSEGLAKLDPNALTGGAAEAAPAEAAAPPAAPEGAAAPAEAEAPAQEGAETAATS